MKFITASKMLGTAVVLGQMVAGPIVSHADTITKTSISKNDKLLTGCTWWFIHPRGSGAKIIKCKKRMKDSVRNPLLGSVPEKDHF
ncbi:hypothetical protein ACQVTS_32560 [Bacillus mycoides]|uniref:hypothetical protein n=1 Tax=Bacillus mycoides TaxID=1405 RepID=UPI003D65B8D7